MKEGKVLKFWELSAEQLLKELDSNYHGLTQKEALKRQKKSGLNEIGMEKRRTAWSIFFSQFQNPLLVILILASLVSAFLGEIVSATIIFLMIGFSAVISFFQEYRSEKTIELLKKKVSLKADVKRDGKRKTVHAHDLVVGDLVYLALGQVVPADLRLTSVNGLTLNESILTGESFPVEKTGEPQKVSDYLPQAMKNLAFMGTHVAQGSGQGIVVAIGRDTEFGRTAKLISGQEEQSEFQRGVSNFGYFLFRIIIVFSMTIFLFLALFKGNWLDALLFSLSIAVGISPELLPMIITINLSQAARKMAKHSVIVKKLMAIEDLGNADVLCTDKTGTLTEGQISLHDYFDLSGHQNGKLLEFAKLCNCLSFKENVCHNPLDKAIMDYNGKTKDYKSAGPYKVIKELTFDFNRRRMSAIVQNKERLIITKGATEEMLSVCAKVEIDGAPRNLKPHLQKIKNKIKEQESHGFKIMLLAYRKIAVKSKYECGDESDLILLGFLVFNDPLKKTAADSLRLFREMGVSIKLLTGDTAETARFLARETGFPSVKTVAGSSLDRLSNSQLKKIVSETDIFAKVTPEHKLKIIKALRESGHSVAFLGDGVNDAPALRAADVGISVDSGSDVAKEVADVILLKKSLRVLIDGIKEGRRTFGNTMKYIFCTISSNYGNMFSVVGASIILPFIPLLPVQILLLNFLSDFPMLAVSTDTVDDEYLRKPKRWNIKVIKKFMSYFGLVSSAFDFLTYGFLLLIVKASMPLFQVGWFWQSFLTEVLLIFVIRTRLPFFKSRPSNGLIAAFAITVVIVLLVMYTPIAGFFGFATMPLWVNLSLIAMSAGYFIVVELGKQWFYRRYDI